MAGDRRLSLDGWLSPCSPYEVWEINGVSDNFSRWGKAAKMLYGGETAEERDESTRQTLSLSRGKVAFSSEKRGRPLLAKQNLLLSHPSSLSLS